MSHPASVYARSSTHHISAGIVFDVVECLIQRNWGYATTDVRVCYRIIIEKIYNPQYSKVIFVLHSQGAIEGSLILDWLLQELPRDLLSKLEVYTFGNAANHFNNPHGHKHSQTLAKRNPLAASIDSTRLASVHEPAVPRVRRPQPRARPSSSSSSGSSSSDAEPYTEAQPLITSSTTATTTNGATPIAASTEITYGTITNGTTTNGTTNGTTNDPIPPISLSTTTPDPSHLSDRVIGHIEHYAHTTDFVALWGVLHFATAFPSSPASTPHTTIVPRFRTYNNPTQPLPNHTG